MVCQAGQHGVPSKRPKHDPDIRLGWTKTSGHGPCLCALGLMTIYIHWCHSAPVPLVTVAPSHSQKVFSPTESQGVFGWVCESCFFTFKKPKSNQRIEIRHCFFKQLLLSNTATRAEPKMTLPILNTTTRWTKLQPRIHVQAYRASCSWSCSRQAGNRNQNRYPCKI